jgi:hypothetical protein
MPYIKIIHVHSVFHCINIRNPTATLVILTYDRNYFNNQFFKPVQIFRNKFLIN